MATSSLGDDYGGELYAAISDDGRAGAVDPLGCHCVTAFAAGAADNQGQESPV